MRGPLTQELPSATRPSCLEPSHHSAAVRAPQGLNSGWGIAGKSCDGLASAFSLKGEASSGSVPELFLCLRRAVLLGPP